MLVFLKCKNCGHEFFVDSQVIEEYKSRQEMAKSLKAQADIAAIAQISGQLLNNDSLFSMQSYARMRDVNVLNSQSKALRSGANPLVCPNCNSDDTRPMTQNEIKIYVDKIKALKEDEEKRENAKNRKINPNATIEQLKERILSFIEDEEWYDAEHYVEYAIDMAATDYYLYYLQFLINNRCKNNKELFLKGIGFDQNDKLVSKIYKYADNGFLVDLGKHNMRLRISNEKDNPLGLLQCYKDISKIFDKNDELSRKSFDDLVQSINNINIANNPEEIRKLNDIYDNLQNFNFDEEQIGKIKECINTVFRRGFGDSTNTVFEILNFIFTNINLNEEKQINIYIISNFEKYGEDRIRWILNKNDYIDYVDKFIYIKQEGIDSFENFYSEVIDKMSSLINEDIAEFEKIDVNNIDYNNIQPVLVRFNKVKAAIDKFELTYPNFNSLVKKFDDLSEKYKVIDSNYSKALDLYNKGCYFSARKEFEKYPNFKDSNEIIEKCNIMMQKKSKRNKLIIKCGVGLVCLLIIINLIRYFSYKYGGPHDYFYSYSKSNGTEVHITSNCIGFGLKKINASNYLHNIYPYCTAIVFDNKIAAKGELTCLFNANKNLRYVSSIENLDVSKVEDMSYMFAGCISLQTIEGLQNLDVSKVKKMNLMFAECINLRTLEGLRNWDVSQVEYMIGMFEGCSKLQTLVGLDNWDVSKVKDMRSMFDKYDSRLDGKYYECSNLWTVDALRNWDVSKVENMNSMFAYCKQLQTVEGLQNWDVSKVEDMGWMFEGCSNLQTLDGLQNWDVSKVEDMRYMFEGCNKLRSLKELKKWHLKNKLQYDGMAPDQITYEERESIIKSKK